MILDEAPLTCGPIPLQDWTADMGGRGVTIHLAAQSLAQLRDMWGADRAEAICGNVAALMVFGGIKSAEDLDRVSTLTGTRLVQLDSGHRRPIPVMTPAEIAALPRATALVLCNGMRPVIGRAPMVWDRRPNIASRLRCFAVRVRGAAVTAHRLAVAGAVRAAPSAQWLVRMTVRRLARPLPAITSTDTARNDTTVGGEPR